MPSKPAALVGSGALVLAVGTSALLSVPQAASEPSTGGLGSGSVSLGAPQAVRATNPGHPITVTSTAVGQVRPGSPSAVDVTVRNDNNQPVVLTEVSGSVTSVAPGSRPGLPACRAEWYSLGSFAGSRTIAKNGSTVVRLSLVLEDLAATNQDNCQGAAVQLRFTARARQA